MSYENQPPVKPPDRPIPILLFVFLAFILGLGMGLVGFLVGRVTAPAQQATELAAPLLSSPPATLAQEGDDLPTAVAEIVASATSLPPTETPTPPPTETLTTVPTDTPPPTPEPTATPPEEEPASERITSPDGSPLGQVDFTTFYEVWDIIAGGFDGSLPPSQEMLEAIISGSLETLDDDYTRYVPPDVAERMRQDEDGEVEGIGAFVIENEEGLFEIVRPIDGQPADLAGVKAGDVLIEIDGQSVVDLSFDEVILMVRGPQGTTVNLTFVREGEEEALEFSIVRTRFVVPVVESEMLPAEMTGGELIGYIRLAEFNRNAENMLLDALTQLLDDGATALVFDLRDNPGGFVDQSVAVADVFLPSGTVLVERNIRGLNQVFQSFDGDMGEELPLVVLVNAGSASASEIVAGAIQDLGRAVLVGETTFGKGSVQQIHTLSDGAELRVTIARWYTPNDSTIDGEGITPDIEVETPEDLGGPEDGQLLRAIEYLLTGQ